ncbi:MAG TPA: YebC/PmpR family DNA-binding transcriptional regulator [Steroidobacteraceae bacterium]|nr:YebC/PmpR family DNA-binding transcriptional regulator [Steroidobacteraceae bacterium]
MAGHLSWASIQRRKGELAARRRQDRERSPRAGQQLVRFEGYGPGGAAVIVECLTDDRARVGAQVRHAFLQHGGNLGADGSVGYLFNTVGLMTYPAGTDEERLMQVALEAGAEDVVPNGDRSMEVLADPAELETVRAVLTHRGFAPQTAEVTQRAAMALPLSGEPAELMVQMLEALQGLEEVRDVYSNVEIADEVLGGR